MRGKRPDWVAYDTIAGSSVATNPKRPRARGKERGGVRASTHLAHSARGDVAKHFTRVVPVQGVARGSASRGRPLGFFSRIWGATQKNLVKEHASDASIPAR